MIWICPGLLVYWDKPVFPRVVPGLRSKGLRFDFLSNVPILYDDPKG